MAKQERKTYLSKREQQIMDLLVTHERLSAADIEKLLPDAPTNSTVRSLLTIMVEKGITTRVASGRSFVYKLVKPKTAVAKDALIGVIQRFFDGSVGGTVTALIESRQHLSDEEIEAIQRLIDASKEENS
jgi:predicted transcriptional regulator